MGKREGKRDLTRTLISERSISIFLQFERTYLGCCFLLWFNPSHLLLPNSTMGRRTRRLKLKKRVVWDKDSLISKSKAMHASKAK